MAELRRIRSNVDDFIQTRRALADLDNNVRMVAAGETSGDFVDLEVTGTLTIDALSGVLKASAGLVSGDADFTDLGDTPADYTGGVGDYIVKVNAGATGLEFAATAPPGAHTHVLTDVTDVTATAAEVNLLDLSGLTIGWVLKATGASSAAWGILSGSEINNDLNWTVTGHSHVLTDVTDVTALAAEVNLLDLAGLSVGWVLRATGAASAAWAQLTGSDIDFTTTGHTHPLTEIETTGASSDNAFIKYNGANWAVHDLFSTANTWDADQTLDSTTKLLVRTANNWVNASAVDTLSLNGNASVEFSIAASPVAAVTAATLSPAALNITLGTSGSPWDYTYTDEARITTVAGVAAGALYSDSNGDVLAVTIDGAASPSYLQHSGGALSWSATAAPGSHTHPLTQITGGSAAEPFIKYNGANWAQHDLFGTANTWDAIQTFDTAHISSTNSLVFKGAATDGTLSWDEANTTLDFDEDFGLPDGKYLRFGTGDDVSMAYIPGTPNFTINCSDPVRINANVTINGTTTTYNDLTIGVGGPGGNPTITFDDTSNLTMVWDNSKLSLDQNIRLTGIKQCQLGNGTAYIQDLTGAGYLTFAGGSLLFAMNPGTCIMSGAAGTTAGSSVTTSSTSLVWGTSSNLDLKDGATSVMKADGDALYPNADYSYDLGTSSKRWDRLYHHDYASVTVTADSTASAAEYDIFDEDNYAAFTSTANVTAQSITYTSTDGRFTCTNAGIYLISLNLIMTAGASQNVSVIIDVNGVAAYQHDVYCHTSVDAVERTVTIMQSLSASDYVNFAVDGSASTVTVQDGTTANLLRFC